MNFRRNFYWNNFYSKFSLSDESSFARFSVKYFKKFFSFGCCMWKWKRYFFYQKGIKCKGIDISKIAIKNNSKKLKNIFEVKDACSDKFKIRKKYDYIYCRFFLHTIDQESEKIFLGTLKKL